MLRPTAYPYERAAVLTIWTLGALVLHEHLERLIGVDLLRQVPDDMASAAAYVGPVTEIMTEGIVTPQLAARMRAVFGDADVDPTERPHPATPAPEPRERPGPHTEKEES
jgi:hypothetical protein